jgi:hypothetical protein
MVMTLSNRGVSWLLGPNPTDIALALSPSCGYVSIAWIFVLPANVILVAQLIIGISLLSFQTEFVCPLFVCIGPLNKGTLFKPLSYISECCAGDESIHAFHSRRFLPDCHHFKNLCETFLDVATNKCSCHAHSGRKWRVHTENSRDDSFVLRIHVVPRLPQWQANGL